jgi:predicted enzyme related to lactoylglutathione lyase
MAVDGNPKEESMPNDVAHFAIHADDCQRAKRFYETVFGWSFEPWGPPDFWLIQTSPGALRGALQKRREPVAGKGMIGYECTISVADLDPIATAIEANGGTVTTTTTPPLVIETVGTLLVFEDTEGNVVGAMRYDDPARCG